MGADRHACEAEHFSSHIMLTPVTITERRLLNVTLEANA